MLAFIARAICSSAHVAGNTFILQLNLVFNNKSRIEQLFYRVILTAAGMFAGLPIASFKRRVYSAYILE